MAICGLTSDQSKTLFTTTTIIGCLGAAAGLGLERYLPQYATYFRRGAIAAGGLGVASLIGRISVGGKPDLLTRTRTILNDPELEFPTDIDGWNVFSGQLVDKENAIKESLKPLLADTAGYQNDEVWTNLGQMMDIAQLRSDLLFEITNLKGKTPEEVKEFVRNNKVRLDDLMAPSSSYQPARLHLVYGEVTNTEGEPKTGWHYSNTLETLNGPLANQFYEKGTPAYELRMRYNTWCEKVQPYLSDGQNAAQDLVKEDFRA